MDKYLKKEESLEAEIASEKSWSSKTIISKILNFSEIFLKNKQKVSELNIQLGYLKNEKFLMFRKTVKNYLRSKYFNMSSQIKGKY